MKSREMYVLGWVSGRIAAAKPNIKIDVASYCGRPYSGLAQTMATAHREHVLSDALNREIAAALSEITEIDDQIATGESEVVQPFELQGSWQLGYYAGLSGRPLPEPEFNIAAARKAKGLSQQQLADCMGVDQALVCRWERKIVTPNKENMERLKKILTED